MPPKTLTAPPNQSAMKKILTVIGARPQIIKAAALSRAVADSFADRIDERILHTGQHYDANMSQVFFDELGIPAPHYNLGVGSGSHGVQTARIIEGIESVLTGPDGPFDGIVIYGDTNSTLAAAVAAAKLHVPIFHIEAGLRSNNMTMPEEVNRIVADQLSSILFAPTQTAVDNLRREGFDSPGDRERFAGGKGREVVNAGDVMYDNSMHFADIAPTRTDIISRLGLQDQGYILSTIHRPANTDSAANLRAIVRALLDIADGCTGQPTTVVLPLHPRTRKLLPQQLDADLYRRLTTSQRVRLIDPVSFFEIIELERHAAIVMTDSGGVQKEAFFFQRPCVILRPETEWVEIVDHGAGIIADADYHRILGAHAALTNRPVTFPPLFGDARAAHRILTHILAYLTPASVN